MREDFHGELDQLRDELALMCGLACSAMERAVQSLLDVDLSLAEQVISDDDEIERLAMQCDERACTLLALQSPVARDLRTVISGLRAAEKIKRMGDLAQHVAEVVRRRHPEPVVPEELAVKFAAMGHNAVAVARATQRAITAPAKVRAPSQERADDRTDELQAELLADVSRAESGYSVRIGVDVALVARFIERFADQAVAVTRQLDYVVTGEPPHQVV
ncbi:phosphate signaling complex protein PhoU [Pseudonocardia spinosispora]|uniref:phosphate signaling complex protein PhoU n=1 Tax=Pseudonocardia spinosispora TaxID=103441 RepID=UPI000404DE7A|nr:phosphate signaling complex protein PhoU [Pseudonocardia spinosispora]